MRRRIELHRRFAEGHYERIPALLDGLLRLDPAALAAAGPRPAIVARDAEVRRPVVVAAVDDPVQMKLAQSHALGLTIPARVRIRADAVIE